MTPSLLVFVKTHWELCLAFVLILVYWLASEVEEFFNQHSIGAAHVVKLMNHHHAVVIDIREKELFKHGHILGAVSFPQKELMDNLDKLKKYREKKIILVDANGKSANKILNKIIGSGCKEVFFLKNGLHAWHREKLPVEKSDKSDKSDKEVKK